MENIAAFLIDQAFARGLAVCRKGGCNTCIFSKGHTPAGFDECAVVLGIIPADRSYSISRRFSPERLGRVLIQGDQRPSGIVLYPPEHHREFIEKTYESLKIKRVFGRKRKTAGSILMGNRLSRPP
jgi:hypothetical protein